MVRPCVCSISFFPLGPLSTKTSTVHRGFRQATRGPDTGAFSHPLFQRDKPELCSGMVCQRSRELGSPEKSKNKARRVESPIKNSKASSKMDMPSPDTKAAHPEPTVGALPSDTSSVEQGPMLPTLQVPDGIVNNQSLVHAVLKQRDEIERLRAAKAMLYDSYMKALRNDSGKSS